MPIISHRLRFIEKFLSCFKSNFSKIQMEVFREFTYAMFVNCKRMSLASIANNTTINYQKLQYFFSESNCCKIKEQPKPSIGACLLLTIPPAPSHMQKKLKEHRLSIAVP
jgi:hypothetical protein